MLQVQACRTCKLQFTYERNCKRGRLRLYCSPACRKIANPPRQRVHIRDCVVCGNTFGTPNARTRCCGTACGGILGKRLGDLARKANALRRNARTCKRCGVAFQRMRGAPGYFCSKACAASSKRLYANRREAKAAARKRARERHEAARRATEQRQDDAAPGGLIGRQSSGRAN
jgi:predicted nucleic acid-binding Zn ribbon protein